MTATTGTLGGCGSNDRTTRAAYRSVAPSAVTSMDTDIAKKPSSTKNKEPVVSKKKAEPEDINPKAATRRRTDPDNTKTPVEANKDPAEAATVASATETTVNTTINITIFQLVELLMMSADAEVVVKGLCGLLEAVTDDSSDLLDIAITGANSAVLYTMVINTDSPIVQAKACSLISHLAVDARNQFAICLLQGLEDINKEDFGVQKAALDGLGVLFSHKEEIQSIVKNDVIMSIGRALANLALANFSCDEKVAFQNKAFDVSAVLLGTQRIKRRERRGVHMIHSKVKS
jgi:hypothetical protein